MPRSLRFMLAVLVLATVAAPTMAHEVEELGTLEGKVVFKGDPDKHKQRWIVIPEDAKCTTQGRFLTENVVINLYTEPLTLRNVIVSIKEGPVDRSDRSLQRRQLMVTQNCRFSPHVVALLDGLSIDVRNDDTVPHNVHFMAKVNREHNFTIPRKGMQMSVVMDAEDPIEIKSDFCPWMSAWLAVFDHPYFLITGEEGTFAFEGVPSGKYVLEAWHETFGKKTITVEVGKGETKQADFVFEPDKK